MAGIDKIYLKNLDQFKEFKSWLSSVGIVKDDYGNIIRPLDYLREYSDEAFQESVEYDINHLQKSYERGDFKDYVEEGIWTKEEYDNFDPSRYVEVPVMNNPLHIDIFLIRNCPLDYIQKRLKEQYSREYEDILKHTSIFDTYQRNGLGKNIKVKFPKQLHIGGKIRGYVSNIEFPLESGNKKFDFTHFDYYNNYWSSFREPYRAENCLKQNNDNVYFRDTVKSKKALFRKLQGWDLPEGSKVTLIVRGELFELIIRRR